MSGRDLRPVAGRRTALLLAGLLAAGLAGTPAGRADTVASLLGNFTINQFCALTFTADAVTAHYTVLFGQLPALRELHAADADGNGVTSQGERDTYVGRLTPRLADGLELRVDGVRVPLLASRWSTSLPAETGGFSLRVDIDLRAVLPAGDPHAISFANRNYGGRMGWHELTVHPGPGAAIYDTDAYATSATNGLTDALAALPETGPLDERTVHMTVARSLPAGATPIGPRRAADLPQVKPAATSAATALGAAETGWITHETRALVEAISGPRLDPRVALWALLGALVLGAVHALSPGHGKTIVGAYLIGSRGTPRHALFLGFTVTVTHTIGVFVLGFATLYASRYVVPERLFPVLSLISALLVLGMGLVLLIERGRAARRALGGRARRTPVFVPVAPLPAGARPRHAVLLAQPSGDIWHSHGGGPMHSHLPPGAAGERVTWKSLLALGISGGLVPCPSAMVLLLAAIALNKTGYGMLLVLVFSLGLAVTLTLVGLLFLYARNRVTTPGSNSRWRELLPVSSAAAITLVGAALLFAALKTFR